MDRPRKFDTVELKVGKIVALCPRCRARSFLRARRTQRINSASLICTHCGLETVRTVLMKQLGDQVVRQSRAMLASLRGTPRH
jgi:hypothetical protein